MSRKPKHNKVSKNKQQIIQKIARITIKRLAVIISALLVIIAFFIFTPGEGFWPAWMIDSRKIFVAIFGIITAILILMSPIIVVTESDPRPLSGPGKNPYL